LRIDAIAPRALRFAAVGCVAAWLVLMAGCRQEMSDQPRYEPLEASSFFEDGRASRPLVPGTVARGDLRADAHLYTGRSGGRLVDAFPFSVTREALARGRERYDIFCSPCHDRVGYGQGMVARRGFGPPPSFHIDRLRDAPVGHFFDVISHGKGDMPDYAAQVSARDRWAIVAYIRALQLSQRASLADIAAAKRQRMEQLEP